MAKLVVLSEGFTGLSCEVKGEKISVGRVEDNNFQIPEPSVSSHHCEVSPRGAELAVHDLNSTNGTFINGEQITDGTLKPGQILRLGQVELRLDTGTGGPPPVPAPPAKKPMDKTVVIPQGVKIQELDPTQRPSVETSAAFSKKTNKTNTIFIAIGIALGVVIVVILLFAFIRMS